MIVWRSYLQWATPRARPFFLLFFGARRILPLRSAKMAFIFFILGTFWRQMKRGDGAGAKRDATKRQHLISLSYNVTKRVANRWRLLYLWLWIQQLLKVQGSPCHTTQDRSVGPGQFVWQHTHTHQHRRMRNGKLNPRFGQTQRGRAQSRFDDPTDLAKATQRFKQKKKQPKFKEHSSNIVTVVLAVRWRSDGRCGPDFAFRENTNDTDGLPAECDPASERPCCSDFGYCGVSTSHCTCKGCTDYRGSESSTPPSKQTIIVKSARFDY